MPDDAVPAASVTAMLSDSAAAAVAPAGTVSVFDSCTDSCGWIAALVSVLAWGSFGVPIKTGVTCDVHPLVMQSFKTSVCFATSWLVLLLGEKFQWSYWGIASGLFWVPGAACGIYGIRNAGLAVAVGTWSSLGVLSRCVQYMEEPS